VPAPPEARMFVGIDGGGTRTRALLVDAEGREVLRLAGAAGIVDAAHPAAAASGLAELTRSLAQRAGVALPVRSLCCGLAGAGRTAERRAVQDALLEAGIAAHVLVLSDAETAMHDAFGDGPGVLLIAGTGSIAWGRTARGDAVRVGGWGRLIGDEGSGFAIGVAAIRAVLRSFDGRDCDTALTPAVLRAAGCASPADLVAFTARSAKADLAALAPAVLAAAADDPAAGRIREEALSALGELVATAADRAGLTAPALALAGGLIQPGAPLRQPLLDRLSAVLPAAVVSDRAVDAARGAARLAAAAEGGWPPAP
jgi:glucosamine kinase